MSEVGAQRARVESANASKVWCSSPPPLRQRGYGGSRDYHCQKLARNAREWNPPTHPKFGAHPHPPCGSVATGDPVTIIVRSWRATRASGIRQRIQSLVLSPTPLRQRGYGGSRDYHCQKLARNAREWNPPTHPKFGAQPHPPCGSVATGDPVTIIVRSWRATRASGIRQRIQSLALIPTPPAAAWLRGIP